MDENLNIMKSDLSKMRHMNNYKEMFEIVKIYFDDNDFLRLEKLMEKLLKFFDDSIKFEITAIMQDKIKSLNSSEL